jgi:RNA polymerase sigma-70 factor (ECF subfamily)
MAEQLAPADGATAAYADQVDIDGDRELVERFQRGDDTAFAELYSRHYRRLFRTCLRCLGDPATAEDAAQEAFAKALRALPTLNGDRRFYPWLSVIAKRVCMDIHRHRARSQPAESVDPGATADGEQELLTSMDATAVQDALARLTSRHQDVLQLREYEGWSYRRIATHYGVRLAAVETLLWRARRALHRQLTMAGYERRALVSLPVAGWAYRRLGALRARIEEWGGGHRLAPVVGSAASVLTIGALVIGTTGSGAHASRPQPLVASHAPPAADVPAPPLAAKLPGVTVPSVPSVPAVPAHLPAAPAVPPTAGQVVAAGRAAVLGATFTNASVASQQARQAPVHASVAGVNAGLDPKATATGLASTAATTVDQVRRSIP